MANINIKLTLLTAGGNSGPLYNAYYTIDNITYTIAIDGSNLSLPSVGSEVTITIPDNSTNVKLVNLTAGCQDNYYIVPVVTTTTTSTSTSTSTTTSTSTSTTTTTTTTIPPVYYYYNATRCYDGIPQIIFGGTNYYGTGTVVISGGTSYCYTIQNEVGSQPYDDTVGASVPLGCEDPSCYTGPPPPTTTTTSTSTSTTTSTSTSTTTTTTTLPPIGVIVVDTCTTTPTSCDGQFYIQTISGGSGTGYQTRLNLGAWINWPAFDTYNAICGGQTYTIDARDSIGTFASSGPVTICSNPTTTTTTSTTSTTSTTTTIAPVYYYNATRCHDGVNEIIYGGNSYYNVGTVVISGITSYCYTIQNEVIPQAYNDTVGSSVGGCGAAPCYVTPTTTTTSTSTSTTTTTTTCNPTANWVNTGFSCYGGCDKYNVQTDQNPCSPTYNTTRQGSLVQPNSTYCGGCCGQSTTPTWVDNGAAYCDACVSKQPQIDNNPCSPTSGQTRVINAGSACNTTQNWVNTGNYNCYGTCNKYNVEIQNNPCASGYNTTRQGSVDQLNSTFCGGCCGQSTAATWVNTGSYSCYGTCNKYNIEVDNNSCSPTYNQTRQGSLVDPNSTFCGGCCGVSPTANWVNNGTTFCTVCVLYQPQIDNNVCSSTYGNTRNVNLGINNSCGTWNISYYCEGCAYYSKETNSCTGDVRNITLISNDSTSCGGCCGQSTAATWTNEGSAYCESCVSKQLQRDTNPCSATYNQTRVINSGSACNTSANWVNSGSYDCYGTCDKYNVEVDNNPCSPTYNQTRQGSVDQPNSTYCGGCCGQSTTPSWTNEGSAYCDNCVSKQLQRDTNPCSSTYNQTRVINSGSACNTSATWTNEGSAYCDNCVSKQLQRDTNPCSGTYNQTRVINSGTACNYTANWVNSGSYDCYGTCNKYNVEIDNNPCSPTYNDTRQGSVDQLNSTFCGGCCGQSTSPNWVDNGNTFCTDCNLYQPQIDANPCSFTYGDTRNVDLGVSTACGTWVQSFYCIDYDKWSKETNTCTGNIRNETLVQADSPYCGYVPPPTCRTYQIVGDYADQSVDGVYTNCAGSPDSFSFFGGPGTVGYICAQISTVYVTSSNGYWIDTGSSCP